MWFIWSLILSLVSTNYKLSMIRQSSCSKAKTLNGRFLMKELLSDYSANWFYAISRLKLKFNARLKNFSKKLLIYVNWFFQSHCSRLRIKKKINLHLELSSAQQQQPSLIYSINKRNLTQPMCNFNCKRLEIWIISRSSLSYAKKFVRKKLVMKFTWRGCLNFTLFM